MLLLLIRQVAAVTLIPLAFAGISATVHAQSGVDRTTILLGVSTPLTGTESAVGTDYLAGARLAFDAANKAGGVNGRSIKLEVLDDAGKADTTAANTKKLIDQGVFALFGFYGGNNTIAALPTINTAKVPLVGVFTGNQTLRDPSNRYVFHARTGYYDEIAHVSKRLQAMSANKIAVAHFNDRGGTDTGKRTAEEFRKLGVDVKAVVAIERGSTKVETAAATLAKADIQWVVMILTNKTAAALIRETRKQGGLFQFMSLSFTNAAALVEDLGPRESIGLAFAQVVPTPYSNATGISAEFRQLAGKTIPINYVSMEGFVTARLMIEALRRAGSPLTRERLVDALESGRPIALGDYSVSFTPRDRDGGDFVELTVVDRFSRFVR
jgi:branched-chain amino acid transport system substrate-binding protein